MASYNRVIMVGNLTRDPELKQLSSGQSVCRFGLASNRQFKNRQTGSNVQEVCFIDIDVWGPQADSCSQYLQKGRQVLIEGRLKFDIWDDAEGNKRNKHTIVADRVTFLASGAGASDDVEYDDVPAAKPSSVMSGTGTDASTGADSSSAAGVDASAGADMSVMGAQDLAKKKAPSKKTTATGEIDLKDESPFKDDLPF